VAYNLALKIQGSDQEVESKRARVKLNQWVRLHDYNIAQKVQVIVEHFKANIMGLLGGQAKAMVITSSRKEAVRYKLGIDKYIAAQGYQNIHNMVAFSGEVEFSDKDPNVEGLLGEKFAENNMNPNLKGRDMRKAFDSDDYQVMIVANKYQTGFDQLKLCAMYVDKKLGGVEYVQTLLRMNRNYPGKAETGTFVRFYEFMSQIVDYDDKTLEKLSLYARNLRPMLRETFMEEEGINLDNVVLSHYRLSIIRQQDLRLKEDSADYKLEPGEGLGTAKAKDKHGEFLSQIISRLNELFITDHLPEKDLVNYAYTIRDKISKNALVMKQIANNSTEQAMLGDFTKAVEPIITR
jgi:type I site-specific restriction-modification system R (restriction) subunit